MQTNKRPSSPSEDEPKPKKAKKQAPQFANVKFKAQVTEENDKMIFGVIDGPHPVRTNSATGSEQTTTDETNDLYAVSLTIGGQVFNGVMRLNDSTDFTSLQQEPHGKERKIKTKKKRPAASPDVPQLDLTGDDPTPTATPQLTANGNPPDYLTYQHYLQLYGSYNLPSVVDHFKQYFLMPGAQGNAAAAAAVAAGSAQRPAAPQTTHPGYWGARDDHRQTAAPAQQEVYNNYRNSMYTMPTTIAGNAAAAYQFPSNPAYYPETTTTTTAPTQGTQTASQQQ